MLDDLKSNPDPRAWAEAFYQAAKILGHAMTGPEDVEFVQGWIASAMEVKARP